MKEDKCIGCRHNNIIDHKRQVKSVLEKKARHHSMSHIFMLLEIDFYAVFVVLFLDLVPSFKCKSEIKMLFRLAAEKICRLCESDPSQTSRN